MVGIGSFSFWKGLFSGDTLVFREYFGFRPIFKGEIAVSFTFRVFLWMSLLFGQSAAVQGTFHFQGFEEQRSRLTIQLVGCGEQPLMSRTGS